LEGVVRSGGSGQKRTLRLVARFADLCNITGDDDTVRHKVSVLQDHCDAVGRDPAEITVSRLSTLVLTESPAKTASTSEFLRSVVGGQASGYNVGQEDELVDQVQQLKDAGVDYLIFNMPTSGPDAIRRVGNFSSPRSLTSGWLGSRGRSRLANLAFVE
jgi:alkanesulfonate monooxygenase SsuD/methylene tetrahydromethanopterin reductase-like flavin-dependent oxidoreductase (luciferase family)